MGIFNNRNTLQRVMPFLVGIVAGIGGVFPDLGTLYKEITGDATYTTLLHSPTFASILSRYVVTSVFGLLAICILIRIGGKK